MSIPPFYNRCDAFNSRLRVWVEDAVSEAHITTMVRPGTTISELKEKVLNSANDGFHSFSNRYRNCI